MSDILLEEKGKLEYYRNEKKIRKDTLAGFG